MVKSLLALLFWCVAVKVRIVSGPNMRKRDYVTFGSSLGGSADGENIIVKIVASGSVVLQGPHHTHSCGIPQLFVYFQSCTAVVIASSDNDAHSRIYFVQKQHIVNILALRTYRWGGGIKNIAADKKSIGLFSSYNL